MHKTLRRLDRTARHFLTASVGGVTLRHDPALGEAGAADEVLILAARALGYLEGLFGQPIQGVIVYLFSTHEPIQELFGPRYSAAALHERSAVVVPFRVPDLDGVGAGFRLDEVLKHEMAHLFAARWNRTTAPLLEEGLATWLQGTVQGYTIDGLAVNFIRQEEGHLRPLLDPEVFFDPANSRQCYILAGSFTGFLIDRFGWDSYRRLYCELRPDSLFDHEFVEQLGLTLEEAETQWQDRLVKKYRAPLEVWP
jgi:hypothetical protein